MACLVDEMVFFLVVVNILYNEPYPQLRHDIKMAALWGDNVQRAYGEVNVSLCSPCTMQEKTLVRHVNYLPT